MVYIPPNHRSPDRTAIASCVHPIEQTMQKMMTGLKNCFLFLSRFFGSKFWNAAEGYHFTAEKTLTPEELKVFLQYAYANAFLSNGKIESLANLGYRFVPPKDLSSSTIEGLEVRDTCFFDPASGLKVGIFEKEGEVIIGFGALDAGKLEISDPVIRDQVRQLGVDTGVKNWFGGVPAPYLQADRFIAAIREHFPEKKITLSGNCIGGSFASYVALKQGLPAVVLNPLPLGAGLQQEIGDKRLNEADQYITIISVQSEWASDLPLFTTIDRIVSFLGIRTPGNFGKRFKIPTCFGWDICSSHRRVVSAFHDYLRSSAA